MNNKQSPFNNHVEYGLRSLFLLNAIYPTLCDLEYLSCLDYIVVHSGDFDPKIKSIHAPTPNRKNEIFIRRSLIHNGLKLFSKCSLVKPVFENSGILYTLTEESTPYLDTLSEKYSMEVKKRAEWAVETYKNLDSLELKKLIKNSFSDSSGEIAFQADLL